MKLMLTAAAATCLSTAALAEPVIVPSAGSVAETVQRLETSVEDAGARVVTVIDFGGAIRGIGEDIGNLQLVVFANPKIGAAALSADPMAALDLPGKILVYDAGEGTVMAYQVPAEMLAEWDIPSDAPVLQAMVDTLDRITTAAAE